jgi:hypothetical protein
LVGLPAETESGSRVGHEIPEDLRTKIINDTAVYAHSIAEARDRNADWAEDAVRDGVSVGAEEAVELDVVDLVAADRTELLARIDGMTVRLPDGEVTLGAAGALVVEEPMSPFEEFLMVLSDPNIALILLSLGSSASTSSSAGPGPSSRASLARSPSSWRSSASARCRSTTPGWRCSCSGSRCWAQRSGWHPAGCWASAAGSRSCWAP